MQKIWVLLKQQYPDLKTFLLYETNMQFLVAVMLSAQCTDKQVNKVTRVLFKKYSSPSDFAAADIDELKHMIRSTGFFNAKAKNIIKTAKLIVNEYDSVIPDTIQDLVTLPGVGRKTANVVLYVLYGISEGIAIDTHVKRLSFRMGLTTNTDPIKIEEDLKLVIPKGCWGDITNLMIAHGRAVCRSQKPACNMCFLKGSCPKNGLSL